MAEKQNQEIFSKNEMNLYNGEMLNENLLVKLLRPPNMIKKTNLQGKKYDPKFKKPDLQSLIQENLSLKQSQKQDKKMILIIKLRIKELEKKNKVFEGTINKLQKGMNDQGINSTSVYTEILKKKIIQLNTANINAQQQIKTLKKLPNASIYEQNCIEKEHLLTQTIKLQSVIKSMLPKNNDKDENDNFQNKFLKMMKEQNQKLKATVRLLENDITLLKSRHSIQNKVNCDLKKQIQQKKEKLLYKEAECEKLNIQNKNLLFKKANQLRLEQQNKESERIDELQSIIKKLQKQNIRLLQQNEILIEDNSTMKQKSHQLSEQVQKLERQNEMQKKSYEEKFQQLQLENQRIKNDYMTMLYNGSKKRKSKVTEQMQNNTSSKPIKIDEITLALMSIIHFQKEGLKIKYIFDEIPQVSCGYLRKTFSDQPYNLVKQQAIKIAKYLTEDNQTDHIIYNESKTILSKLAYNYLKVAIDKLQQCNTKNIKEYWRLFASKAKRMRQILKDYSTDCISETDFIEIVSMNTHKAIQRQQIIYIILKCFDHQKSRTQIMLSINEILLLFK